MKKEQLLKELLSRVGDPNATSDTIRNLAWSLFVEALYEVIPSIGVEAGAAIITTLYSIVGADSRGIVKVTPPWDRISRLVGVSVRHNDSEYPASVMTEDVYRATIANPYYLPEIPAIESSYYLDGKVVIVATGIKLRNVKIGLSVYSDLRTALDNMQDGADIPIHNATIYAVMPIVSQRLKQEVGLIL